MKEWYREPRIIVAIIIAFLNMEFVVIPWILMTLMELSGITLKVVAALWANAEMIYWWSFCGWVIERSKQAPTVKDAFENALDIGQDAIDFGKKIAPQIKSTGLIERIQKWIKHHILDRFDPKTHENKKLFHFLKSVSYISGCLTLLALGVLPGVWVVGLITCRIANWKMGFAFIILGNIIKNVFGFVWIWENFFSIM